MCCNVTQRLVVAPLGFDFIAELLALFNINSLIKVCVNFNNYSKLEMKFGQPTQKFFSSAFCAPIAFCKFVPQKKSVACVASVK